MLRLPFVRLVGILGTLTLPLLSTLAIAQPSNSTEPKSYIVVLKEDVDPRTVAQEHTRTFAFSVAFTYEHALKGYAASILAEHIPALIRDKRVLFISEDRPMKTLAQSLPTGVDRIQGDISSTKSGDGTGSVNVAVAILDTGIDTGHPDLNVAGGTSCIGREIYDDRDGHGTHTAGIVAAQDNSEGVVGVAPGAPLYAVKVLSRTGSGSTSAVICGIDWVTANTDILKIKVANLSLGSVGSDDGNCGNTNGDALHRAICASVAKGVTYVVAAGNEGQDLATSTPAAYNEVLTVTAVADFNGQPGGGATPTCRSDIDDTAADFSNFTTTNSTDVSHMIAAPGVCITSTWKGSSYQTISGTSEAAPHVAGTVALCIASGGCAGKTPQQIITKLQSDAAKQPVSYGFIDDPNSTNGTRYYGRLVYSGGY